MAALVVGSKIPGILENEAYAAVQVHNLNFDITDAMKQMVTHNAINNAQCYFWLFKESRFPAEIPGPNIFTTTGDTIRITLKNSLDEPHAFFIPGVFNSGPIPVGATRSFTFTAPAPGTYLYYDNLNAPVNRMMGLHGAFIVMPFIPRTSSRRMSRAITPYANPTPGVQRLFNDLGSSPHFPGLPWELGDPANNTPAFRQYVWLLHQASPILFAEVGQAAPGTGARIPANFVNAFFNDPFNPTGASRKPQYFTISGQSGHFSHNNTYICPNHRVGEPAIIRVLNAGLWTHSMHIHANHCYMIANNGVVQANPFWQDTYTSNPLETYDWLLPFHRPPDIPNQRGIGFPDPGLPTLTGGTTWPPLEEVALWIPDQQDELAVELAPLNYPMHDHSEPSQTSQGGNYNLGLISGVNFIGDRTMPGQVNFCNPRNITIHGPSATGPCGGPDEA
jgi:hypothetical protein